MAISGFVSVCQYVCLYACVSLHVCMKVCIARSMSEDDREGAWVHVVGDIHMNILPLLVAVIALVILSLAARLLC